MQTVIPKFIPEYKPIPPRLLFESFIISQYKTPRILYLRHKMASTLPIKIRTNVSIVVAAAITLLMTTLLFTEASATCRQREIITGKDAAAGGGLTSSHISLATGQPKAHVPTPPPPHKSSSGQPSLHPSKPPPPHRSRNVSVTGGSHRTQPSHNVSKPPQPNKSSGFLKSRRALMYCHEQSVRCPPRRENTLKLNNKAELMQNDHAYINARLVD